MRKPRKPVRVGELIETILERHRARASVRSRQTVQVFDAFQRLGPPLTRQCEPLSFRYGTLMLRVFGAVWITELSFLEPEIRGRLNRVLENDRVKRIRFVAGAPRPSSAPLLPPRLTSSQLEQIEAWGAQVSEPSVRAAFMRAAARTMGHTRSPREAPDIRRGTDVRPRRWVSKPRSG
ncbi:MAG: DUF721 domain-containing protein [Myxococcota bacterium]